MKVFYCPMSGGYSGGGIMVAAETKEQAILTAARDKTTSYAFSWWDDEGYIDDDGNIEHLHSDDYPLSDWREMEHLQADFTEPQVILDNGYNG